MKTRIKYLSIGIIGLVALLIAGCSQNNAAGGVVADTAGAITESSGDYISIPISELSSTIKFYNFNDNGVVINYFAVLGSDGKPRTAFDACDVCGGYKGYRQQGTDISCNNCGKVFSIDGLGTKNKGYGCWPSYLSHSIENGNVVISKAELDDGTFRFA